MKRVSWLPAVVAMLLALGVSAGCVRPRPNPTVTPGKLSLGPTATRSEGSSVVVPTVTPIPETPTPAPTATVVEVAEPTSSAPERTPAPAGGEAAAGTSGVTYQVRWGDTLAQIARRFGTTVSAIMASNPRIADRDTIYAGQVLTIPVSGTASSGVAAETGEYTVQRGDTLALIARRFGTSVWALQQANPAITNPNHIWPGQRLVIPLGGEGTVPRTHRVQYGETLTAIAWRYGTTVWAIVVRNNLANPNLIYAGQVLVIP